MRFSPILVSAAATVLSLGGTAALGAQVANAATPVVTYATHTYAASSDVITNPERGFYRYSETHLADGVAYSPLDATALARYRTQDGVTLVFRYFYLERYRTQDTLSSADLSLIAGDFAAARSAGVKLVVRFAYSDSSSADAPVTRVLAHIAQLAPVLNANADVIEALQAGFIGRWGEWYYTDNYASDPTRPWLLSDVDWAARGKVLLGLLDATSPAIRVQVRYPAITQHLLPSSDPRATRVGVHDDCFLASDDDYGTFAQASDKAWLAQQTQATLMGGETCAVDGARSAWPSAAADLAAYHWTFLNSEFDADVLGSWGTAGLTEAKRRLGYRLRLTAASLPATARPGSTATVSLTLTNDGYAAPAERRPVQLVVSSGATIRTVAVTADTRTWAPGKSVQLTAQVPVPTTLGHYTLCLNLPDGAPKLATQAALPTGGTVNAAYAVHLANAGVWDSLHGWNNLGQTLTVG